METAVLSNGDGFNGTDSDEKIEAKVEQKVIVDPEGLTPDELKILKSIRARQMLRAEDTMSIDSFSSDTIDGWAPRVKQGSLGLLRAGAILVPKAPTMDLTGRGPVAIKG